MSNKVILENYDSNPVIVSLKGKTTEEKITTDSSISTDYTGYYKVRLEGKTINGLSSFQDCQIPINLFDKNYFVNSEICNITDDGVIFYNTSSWVKTGMRLNTEVGEVYTLYVNIQNKSNSFTGIYTRSNFNIDSPTSNLLLNQNVGDNYNFVTTFTATTTQTLICFEVDGNTSECGFRDIVVTKGNYLDYDFLSYDTSMSGKYCYNIKSSIRDNIFYFDKPLSDGEIIELECYGNENDSLTPQTNISCNSIQLLSLSSFEDKFENEKYKFNIQILNQYDVITFQRTYYLNTPLLENEEITSIDGSTYHIKNDGSKYLIDSEDLLMNITDGFYLLIDTSIPLGEIIINSINYDDSEIRENTFDDPSDITNEYQDNNSKPIPTGTGNNGIEGVSEDPWGNENYGLPSALYFYYMGDDINAGNEYENWNTNETNSVLGNCSAIQSVQYVPFLRKTDLELLGVPYDIARFGQLQASHPKLDYTPTVYRVKALTTQVKTLGEFKCYNPQKTIGSKRNWRNESRLYNYPYQFAMITDHLNKPFEIKYHLVPNNKAVVKVLQTISDRCSYGLFVDNYKGDKGKLEAMVSTEAHELPSSSSAYNQWYASNKNQVAQNVANMSQTAFLQNGNIMNNQAFNMVNSVAGTVGNLVTGNVAGAISSAVGGFQNNMNMNFQQRMNNVGVQQQIAMNMAMGQDLRNTPNTMISMGSDVYYGLAKGGFQLDLYRFGLTERFNQKLGDYFALYGYKQNRVMEVKTKDRYYYNYVKTVGVNIHGEKIPRSHLEEIKSILDNGVTIWHTFRENVTVGDYNMDNYEV